MVLVVFWQLGMRVSRLHYLAKLKQAKELTSLLPISSLEEYLPNFFSDSAQMN